MLTNKKLVTKVLISVFVSVFINIPAQNKVSVKSGNWSDPTLWSPAGIPVAASNVTISNGHTVDMNTAATCSNITVGTGGSAALRLAASVASTFIVNGSLLVNNLSSCVMKPGIIQIHTLRISGNITNNGTLDFFRNALSFCNVVCSGSAFQTIGGTGSLTELRNITVDKGSIANIVDVASASFIVGSDFLTLRAGTIRFSSPSLSLVPSSASLSIGAAAGIELNNASSILNFGAGVKVGGKLAVMAGTVNVGNAANEDLAAGGGTVNVSGGVLNIAGKYNGSLSPGTFSVGGGTVRVPVQGSSNTLVAPFHISAPGSAFFMSGGSIVILKEGGTGTQGLGFVNTGSGAGSVSGGTLQAGDITVLSGQTISVNSSFPVYDLRINAPSANVMVSGSSLDVLNDVHIVAGTLQAVSPLRVGGDWRDEGFFAPGSSTVTFNSAAAQTISAPGVARFNHLNFTGAGAKTFSPALTCTGSFSVAPGASVDAGAANSTLSVGGDFSNNGSFVARQGLVLFNGSGLQTIGGFSATTFYDLTVNNAGGVMLSQSQSLRGALNLNNGLFDLNGYGFTLVSDAAGTARIGPITGSGDIQGNICIQRYMPGGASGWGLLGSPLASAQTFASWDDDLYISCQACPDGFPGGFNSVYTYNENLPGVYDNQLSYSPVTSIGASLVQGKGYWVFLGSATATLDMTGAPRKFSFSFPLEYTDYGSPPDDGWNLIHNPYPSPVSWTALRAGNPLVNNALYVYNADLNNGAGGYASYVNGISSPAVGAGGIGDNIPMCQGFYVHVTGATTLTATESVKSSQDNVFLRPASSPVTRVTIKGPGGLTDETVFYHLEGSTEGFDAAGDALKLPARSAGQALIASLAGAKRMQINAIGEEKPVSQLPLIAGGLPRQSYTIALAKGTAPEAARCVRLFDRVLNLYTDLTKHGYVYVSGDSLEAQRFVLLLGDASASACRSVEGEAGNQSAGSPSAAGLDKDNFLLRSLPDNRYVLSGSFAGTGSRALIRDLSGKVVREAEVRDNEVNADLSGLVPGLYLMSVQTPGGMLVYRLPVK